MNAIEVRAKIKQVQKDLETIQQQLNRGEFDSVARGLATVSIDTQTISNDVETEFVDVSQITV